MPSQATNQSAAGAMQPASETPAQKAHAAAQRCGFPHTAGFVADLMNLAIESRDRGITFVQLIESLPANAHLIGIVWENMPPLASSEPASTPLRAPEGVDSAQALIDLYGAGETLLEHWGHSTPVHPGSRAADDFAAAMARVTQPISAPNDITGDPEQEIACLIDQRAPIDVANDGTLYAVSLTGAEITQIRDLIQA